VITVVTDGGGGPSRIDQSYSREEKTTFMDKKRPCSGGSIHVDVGKNVTGHHRTVEYAWRRLYSYAPFHLLLNRRFWFPYGRVSNFPRTTTPVDVLHDCVQITQGIALRMKLLRSCTHKNRVKIVQNHYCKTNRADDNIIIHKNK